MQLGSVALTIVLAVPTWRAGVRAALDRTEVGQRAGGIPTSGTVLEVAPDEIRIMQPDGAERTLLLDEDTRYYRDGVRQQDASEVLVGQRVVARYVLDGMRSEATRIEVKERTPSESLGPALKPEGPGAAP